MIKYKYLIKNTHCDIIFFNPLERERENLFVHLFLKIFVRVISIVLERI